ncbi:MAG: hypothetical protein NXH72_10470 [Hyphomonadaceae bacterium]|nr:hypothetical protein [Hyphomonadaceae bacterium]
MSRLFDAYMIVDWSAAAKPVTGANSIWVGIRARDARLKFQFSSTNPKTRLAARHFIKEMAEKLIARGDKLLIGFDFALGYPAGTAKAIGLDISATAPWAAMHAHLARKVKEREDNSNARFALAAGLNYAASGGSHPFWGAPKRDVVSTLSMKKGDFSAPGSLPEHRLCEQWIKANFKANPKSVWQLLGAGSVGSQAMLGIPTVAFIRQEIPNSRVWPFETGFETLTRDALETFDCVIAEVYPSTASVTQKPGEILDQAQVRTLSERLESLDSTGELASAFGPPNSLSSREIHKITAEEGWILAK